MNYTKIYNDLMTSRQLLNRKKGDGYYYESHHIIPKSLGGSNKKENLVLLTFREHFLAHLLLIEMYEGDNKIKMMYAIFRMCMQNGVQDRIVSSKQYQTAKEYQKKSMKSRKGYKHSEQTKIKLSESKKGNKNPMFNIGTNHPNFGKRGKNSPLFGRRVSDSTKEKLHLANKGQIPWNKGKHQTEETKEKIKKSNIGKKRSRETCVNISKGKLGCVPWNKNMKYSNEMKKKIKESLTQEGRKKLSDLHIGEKNPMFGKPSPNRRRVSKFDKNDIFIETYDCISLAAEKNHINPSNLTMCAKGKRKSCGGFIWKYE